MRRLATLAAGLLLAATVVPSARAQQVDTPMTPGKGGSAHLKSTWTIGGARVSIEYGRPALKGRAESQMMPAGKPWRTGADVATILTTDTPLAFGAVTLAPGRYTINTIPGANAWQLVFGTLRTPEQWGVPYQPALEIARVPMTRSVAASPVELVTFSIDPTRTGGVLRLTWGTTTVAAPFTIGKG